MSNIIVKNNTSSLLDNITIRPPDLKKSNRVSDKDFFIPTISEYPLLVSNNYRVPQLKKICKFYKLKVSGNKRELITKIYKYLYLSNYASLIQKYIKGYLCRKWCHAHGPAYLNRNICTNQTDFFTMEDIKAIPVNQFFSYKDKDDFVYGFDIVSLYALYQKGRDNNGIALNPYNRNKLPPDLIKNLRTLIRMSRVLKYDIQIDIKEDNIDSNKQLELRILGLFQSIDQLGNYSNPEWFNNLNKESIIRFLRELHDIWSYRAQLSSEIKREIAPPVGDPFRGTNMHYLNQLSSDIIKKLALSIMETLVKKGINHDSRVLGASYVLCGLTLVSYDAATALPWLYQSVAHV